MTQEPEIRTRLEAAMHAGQRVRVRLDDGQNGRRSARAFVGVPTGIGPWGASAEPHVVIQMMGARGTLIAVAVHLSRVVAVDPLGD